MTNFSGAVMIAIANPRLSMSGSMENSTSLAGVGDKSFCLPGRRLNGDETFSSNFMTLAPDRLEMRKVVTYPELD